MRAELVSILTDTVPLDGLYYEPEAGRARGAALLFHGNTMNFYTGPMRFLPSALVRLGLACLAFNRRGHDILSTRSSRVAEGGAFQTAGEGIEDNRLAARWLAARGFELRQSSVTATAACWRCATSSTIRARPRWCCSPRTAAARTSCRGAGGRG